MVNNNHKKKEGDKKEDQKKGYSMFSPKAISLLAEEVAKNLIDRMPHLNRRPKKEKNQKQKKIENALFLDTSAIIDGRIFDIINLGLIASPLVVPESILLELKHIADSQDTVKRERGRKGLEKLEELKKTKNVKFIVLSENKDQRFNRDEKKEVDEKLFELAKMHGARIVTCDYNLEKKASIQGVLAINVNALANVLKVTAVPGESLHILVAHVGKDRTQGVGYLDDGTMIVVENGSGEIGNTIDVVVSRVIQTAAGRILFAKKI